MVLKEVLDEVRLSEDWNVEICSETYNRERWNIIVQMLLWWIKQLKNGHLSISQCLN